MESILCQPASPDHEGGGMQNATPLQKNYFPSSLAGNNCK